MSGPVSHKLDDWILSVAPRAVAYARSLLRNPDDAEDIVQDCFCRLLAKAEAYDLPQDGLKLLYRSISNACINLKTRRRSFFSLTRRDAENGDDQAEDPPDARSQPPERIAAGNELQDAVQIALQKLPPLQRAAVELKSLGHTQQDIAEILETTPTNAGVLVYRARLALAQFLAAFIDGESVS